MWPQWSRSVVGHLYQGIPWDSVSLPTKEEKLDENEWITQERKQHFSIKHYWVMSLKYWHFSKVSSVTMPIVTIWMWNCTIILQGATTGGKWLKGTQDRSEACFFDFILNMTKGRKNFAKGIYIKFPFNLRKFHLIIFLKFLLFYFVSRCVHS